MGKLSPDADLILRIVAISEILGIETGISKQQIAECFAILAPIATPNKSPKKKGRK